jgi:processive 1,2-diacylglycerol beta-glucosyltransferase
MKILILYANIGNGHFKAAEAIKKEMELKYPKAEIVFKDGLDYSGGLTNKLMVKGYMGIIKYIPAMWGKIYASADTVKKSTLNEVYNIINKYMTIKLKKMFRQEKPDIIITTHPFISKMTSYLKKKEKTNAKIYVVVTDYQVHTFWVGGHKYFDKLFVARDYMKTDCEDYGVEKEKIKVTGLPISTDFKKEYNRKEILKFLELKDKKTFLFFTGGGLGPRKAKKIFIELLSFVKDYQIIIVTGKNEKQKAKFEKIVKIINKINKNNNILILGYTNKVPELMYISECVITKPGGLTLTECMAMGKPMVIINPIPGQEEKKSSFISNIQNLKSTSMLNSYFKFLYRYTNLISK